MELSSVTDHNYTTSEEKIADTLPLTDFEHQDTPMLPKVKLRACGRGRNLMKTRGTSPESSPGMDAEVSGIPASDLACINQSSEDESDWTEAEADPTEVEGDESSKDSIEYVADCSTDTSSSTSTVRNLFNSFVFCDVGPNISDTVHEFTNLLSNIATRLPTAIRSTEEE